MLPLSPPSGAGDLDLELLLLDWSNCSVVGALVIATLIAAGAVALYFWESAHRPELPPPTLTPAPSVSSTR